MQQFIYCPMLYTAEKLSNIINTPASTIRYWANNLYSGWVTKKKNKFDDNAAAIIKEIARLRTEEKDVDEIKDYLSQNFGVVEEADNIKALAIPQQHQLQEHNQKMEEMFGAAVVEMQKSNQLMAQLLTYLLKEKDNTTGNKSGSPKNTQSSSGSTLGKQTKKRSARKSSRAVPPKKEQKKKGFFERIFS